MNVVVNGARSEVPAGATVAEVVMAETRRGAASAGPQNQGGAASAGPQNQGGAASAGPQNQGGAASAGPGDAHGRRGAAGLAVALNGEVVARSAWPHTVLSENDRVEVLAARGGG